MRSSFAAFLRGFVLPFGAVSGRRIIFDGENGRIDFYDAGGNLRMSLAGPGSEDGIRFLTADPDEAGSGYGFVETEILGAGGTRNLNLVLWSPNFTGRQPILLRLSSESQDGTERPLALFAPAGAGFADVAVNNKVIGVGRIATVARATPTAAIGDLTTVADMALNGVQVLSGHTYDLHFHAQAAISAVASTWVIEARVNGATVDRFETVENETATGHTVMLDGTVSWVAPAGDPTVDFGVVVDEATATAATMTLAGTATVLRRLSVTDMGII